jgi:pimeloyl-ACP methyl ester carboxylesterase
MRISSFLLGLPALLMASSCGPSATPPPPAGPVAPVVQPKAQLQPGTITVGVQTAADTGQRYAVYLPVGYHADTAYSVLYCFDAQGRAGLPLQRYKQLADQFGWVLVGSANSRNGQQPQQSLAIVDALLRDTREKFWLDSAQCFVAGFSGGARVAAMAAQQRPQIAGVIGVGAGYQPQPSDRFAYIGFVGTEDFNFQELRQLDMQLQQQGSPNLVEYFVGGHDWPPLPTMAKGFQYQEFRAMANKKRPLRPDQVEGMLARYRNQDSLFAASAEDRFRHELQQKTIAYLNGLADVAPMQALMAELAASPQMLAKAQKAEATFQREMAMREDYTAKLQTASIPDWERMAGMMRKIGGSGQDEEAWLHMRILNFLSLSTYSNANGALQASDLPAADHYIALYALIDPANSEHAVLRANWLMRSAAPSDALASLDVAFKLGFQDWARLRQDPAFQGLQGDPGFETLVTRMQAAATAQD